MRTWCEEPEVRTSPRSGLSGKEADEGARETKSGQSITLSKQLSGLGFRTAVHS